MTAASALQTVQSPRRREAAAEVTAAVRAASDVSGVAFAFLMAKAAQESGFDPNAKAPTSSATGLYQFIDSTWLTVVREHGAEHGLGRYAADLQDGQVSERTRREILALRCDPEVSAMMAAEFTQDNLEYLQGTVGGEISHTDLYLAHFLGAGGAAKFIEAYRSNPGESAAALFPSAAQANRAVFYNEGRPATLAEVYKRFEAKFGADCAAFGGDAGFVPTSPAASGAHVRGLGGNKEVESTRYRGQAFGGTTAPMLSLTVQMMLASLAAPGDPEDDGNVLTRRGSNR